MHNKRITVEEVKAAIERTGMKLITGEFIFRQMGQLCGCAIGVLAVDAGVPKDSDDIDDWSDLQFGIAGPTVWRPNTSAAKRNAPSRKTPCFELCSVPAERSPS